MDFQHINIVEVKNVNWGYFQLTQYLMDNVEFESIEDLFPLFLTTNFFATSGAYIGDRVENRKQGWQTDTTYGRHYLVDISKLETRKYTMKAFTERLQFTIADQMDYSLKHVEIPGNAMAYKKQIMNVVKTLLTPGTIIHEIFVDEDRKYHGGHGAAIWDYFRSYIAIDRADRFIYRIEHGRD